MASKSLKASSKKTKSDSFTLKTKAKTDEKTEVIDSTFVLSDLNVSSLDRNYVLPEIVRKQEREMHHDSSRGSKCDEGVRGITTSLEKLGISTLKKDPVETVYWGDNYKIQLFINDHTRYELRPDIKIKCTWCHQYPQEGSLMLAVPYKYVSSFIHEHVYAPECVNVVKGIRVETGKAVVTEKTKKTDPRSALKMNYYKRDLSIEEKSTYSSDDDRVEQRDYFEATKPVCNFNCVAKGTLVMMADGSGIPIEELKTNNKPIIAWDPDSKALVPAKQIAFFNQGKKECVELVFSDGRKIVCTPDHRFLSFENTWIEAKDIKIVESNGTNGVNRSEKSIPTYTLTLVRRKNVGIKTTYDISVENPYNSFVANGIVVHNCMESKGRELAIKDNRFRNVKMYIAQLYQRIFGVLPGKITPAGPFEILEEYGGDFTLEEYRRNFMFVPIEPANQFIVKSLLSHTAEVFTTVQEDI